MKINFTNLILFIILLSFTVVSGLALFGDDTSVEILHWLRNRLIFLILGGLCALGMYYLFPFIVQEEE